METKQLMIWWSIATTELIALFWTIWYFNFGEVPVVTKITMGDGSTLILPFGISRWWDIACGPVWSVIFITLIKDANDLSNENWADSLAGIILCCFFVLIGLFQSLPISLCLFGVCVVYAFCLDGIKRLRNKIFGYSI